MSNMERVKNAWSQDGKILVRMDNNKIVKVDRNTDMNNFPDYTQRQTKTDTW